MKNGETFRLCRKNLKTALRYPYYITSIPCWPRIRIRVTPRERKIKDKKMFGELKESFAYVTGFPPMKYVVLLLALVSLVGMPYSVLMPVVAGEVLGGGSSTFGFLMAASGAGAFTAALYLASRRTAHGLQRLIPGAAALFGAGLIALALSRLFPLSLFFMLFTGMGMMLQMASSNTLLQTLTTDEMRGRVMSYYTLAFMGTAPFGSLLAGSLAKWMGASHTILAGGIVCILGALIYRRKLPLLEKAMAAGANLSRHRT